MAPADDTIKQPAKNASKDDWYAFALTQGKTVEFLLGLKRDDIAALFANEADATAVTSTPTAKPTTAKVKKQIEAADDAGEAMTEPGANPLMRAGAEDLPPHLRAGAVHRAVVKK